MKFEPIFFADKLRIINPRATLAVVTLWSGIDYVMDKFREAGVDLDEETSKIAVFGNFYLKGLRYLLRNLLYNPQIDTLLVFGSEKSDSYRYLENFFRVGVEPVARSADYNYLLEVKTVRVIGTDHRMDDLVKPEMFTHKPRIERIEGIGSEAAAVAAGFIQEYESKGRSGPRIKIDAPEQKLDYYPSNTLGHTIIEDRPLAAWKSLVHRIYRFGELVDIKKGERKELQNVKVVINSPDWDNEAELEKYGVTVEKLERYQSDILDPVKPEDKSYSYGNRIRDYFGIDTLEEAAKRLKEGLDDRKTFISLWDTKVDFGGKGNPCLVTLFFRKMSASINLTATYRTHNAGEAWLENVYGLMAIQSYVTERCRVSSEMNYHSGPITVVSHSISLDPDYMEWAKEIHDEMSESGPVFREDPNGYFVISVVGDDIVARHFSHNGNELGVYRGKKPGTIKLQLYRNCAISDINHAMYVGMELEKAYQCLKSGERYEQS